MDSLQTEFSKFLSAFLDASFVDKYSNILTAFSVCFVLMLVYGLLIRPFLSLAGANRHKMFDVIPIVLILLIGVNLVFPDMFSKNDVVETPDSFDENYIYVDKRDLTKYDSIYEPLFLMDVVTVDSTNCEDFHFPWCFYSSLPMVNVVSYDTYEEIKIGVPCFYIGETLFYSYVVDVNNGCDISFPGLDGVLYYNTAV